MYRVNILEKENGRKLVSYIYILFVVENNQDITVVRKWLHYPILRDRAFTEYYIASTKMLEMRLSGQINFPLITVFYQLHYGFPGNKAPLH